MLSEQVTTVQSFAAYPGIQGCQVKMLTGSYCASPDPVDPARVANAVARLKMAAFVGLTDEWDDSICLFHAMYGGRVESEFFTNLRNTSASSVGYQSETGMLLETSDPWDWQLYMAAVVIVRQRQHEYGVPVRKLMTSP